MRRAAERRFGEYIWADEIPIAVVADVSSAPALHFVHTDHLMRPARMTNALGGLSWDVVYRPFGEVNNISEISATQDLRFPGQWFQLQNGLAYNWHRQYDASLGRYVSADPLGLSAMLSDGPANYNYARQRPGVEIDEEGLQIDGKGHHRVHKEIRGDLSIPAEARQVFEKATSGTTGNGPDRHQNSKLHMEYNRRVSTSFQSFCESNNINPKYLTADQARAFVRVVETSRDPVIRAINSQADAAAQRQRILKSLRAAPGIKGQE